MKWQLIIIGYFSLFVSGFIDNIRGPLFPEILRNLNLTDTQGAAFFSVASLFAFFGSFIIRYVFSCFGAIRSLQIGLLSLAMGAFCAGISTTLPLLLFASSLMGIGFGSLAFVQNVLVKSGSSPTTLRRALAGLHSMYGIASFLSPILVSLLFKLNFNWSYSFMVAAFSPLLLLIVVTVLTTIPNNSLKISITNLETSAMNFNLTLSQRCNQLCYALMLASYVVAEILVSTRLALYLKRIFNFNIEDSSLYVAGFFSCLLAGRLFFTILKIKKSNAQILFYSLIFTFLSLILGLFLHPIFLVVTSLFMAPFFPVTIAYSSDVFKDYSNSAISYATVTYYAAIVVMHVVVGIISDKFGIQVAMYLAPAAIVLAFVLFEFRAWYWRKQI